MSSVLVPVILGERRVVLLLMYDSYSCYIVNNEFDRSEDEDFYPGRDGNCLKSIPFNRLIGNIIFFNRSFSPCLMMICCCATVLLLPA